MKRIVVTLIIATVCGCAVLTPAPVIRAGEMQSAALIVVRTNQEKVIDQMLADQVSLVRDAYRMALTAEERNMVGPDGTVVLDDYKAYVGDLADALAGLEGKLTAKAQGAKTTLDSQINTALALGAGVQAYNKATGISDETFAGLVSAGTGLVDTGITEYGKYRTAKEAADAADQAAKEQRRGIQQVGVLEFFRKVQASQAEGGTPLGAGDIQALLDALQGKVPVPPPAPIP